MKYLGGKERIAKQIVEFLESERDFAQLYVEPFMGSGAIFYRMTGPKIGGDLHPDLMLMWQALQNGWTPPTELSEAEYLELKNQTESSPLRAFAGFGCSFGGKWFGGYAREKGRNFAMNAHNSLMKKKDGLHPDWTELRQGHYGWATGIEDAIIYCDIPYRFTTKYMFDFWHDDFYTWARKVSKRNKVFVSEYQMPDDFKCVFEINRNLELKSKDGNQARVERIFTIGE